MNAPTEKKPDIAPAERPVSVYNLNFGRELVTDAELAFLMERVRPRKFAKTTPVVVKPIVAAVPKRSARIFNLRNAGIFAAILAVGLAHLIFQLNVIRDERGELKTPRVEAPRIVDAEPAPLPPEFATRQVAAPQLPAEIESAPRRRAVEAPRLAPAPRRERPEPAESRAARLRRAEKILTGV